jgi:aerobic-type carbon monoxide dehydrogenase small subunit (CoxS/CutS family)
MATFALRVNRRSHTVDLDSATPLLYVLGDDLALNGPKFGCGLWQCGACTVLVRGRVFGVSGTDPGILAVAVMLLVLVTARASLLPAWRASRVDPMVALRCE